MIWSECKEIWSDGPREYVMHLWNVLDFGMLSIFVASFTARFMAFLKASKAQQYVDMHVPDQDLSNASLPDEIAYFTYGEQQNKISKVSNVWGFAFNPECCRLFFRSFLWFAGVLYSICPQLAAFLFLLCHCECFYSQPSSSSDL